MVRNISRQKQGKLTLNDVILEKHEITTIAFFLNIGKNIELIPPSNTPHTKRPDFIMDGIEWEMKCPQKLSPVIAERSFHKALKQSCNIILDLRCSLRLSDDCIKHLAKCFYSSRKERRMLIITRQSLLEYKK